MTNKELFIKVIERARKEKIALNELERALNCALGYVEIKNDDLTACFSFCDKICSFLLFGRKNVPDYFYDVFWAFIRNGSTNYVSNGSYRLIATAEDFWNFWEEEAYGA